MNNKDEIVKKVEYHKKLYRDGKPEITDYEYDILLEQLEQTDPDHYLLNTVEEEQFNKPTVKHPKPMLSTEKVFSIEDLQKWFNRIEKKYGELVYKVTPKLDGLAARYNSGMLFTRGDWEVGYDITDAFSKGLRIYNDEQLKDGVDYIGEIVMNIHYFNEYMSGHFSHPRNVVVGGVKSDELSSLQQKAFKDGAVLFVPFNKLPSFKDTSEKMLNALDFLFEQLCDRVPFLTDGLVVEVYDNDEVKQELGNTSHHYRWQIAYKVQTEKKRTTAKNIIWQTGRGGNITPVLEVEPVEVSGAVVSRVTAHNYGYLKERGIGEGTVIEIIRSGEVIPKVIGVISGQVDSVPYIYHCPECGEDTILINDIIKCPNFNCPAQIQGRLQHFFKTLKIDGFGPKTIEKLVDGYEIDNIIDVFNMAEEDFERYGFSPGQAKNLFNELFDALNRSYEDWKLLSALSIPLLGKSEAKKLTDNYTLMELLEGVSKEELLKIDGFGEKKSESVCLGLRQLDDEIEFIIDNFEVEDTKMEEPDSDILKGNKFVFTGKMNNPRKEMQNLCEQYGGINQSSVSSKTDYLVCGQDVGQKKIDKAEKLGIMIILEDDFMRMIS